MKNIVEFLHDSPSAFGAVRSIREILLENGYEELEEASFSLEKGKKYFLTRNDTSVIAFNIGKRLRDPSVQICSSHTDSPLMKLKPNALIKGRDGVRLNVEVYGGPLVRPWFDRPLGLSGRVLVRGKEGVEVRYYQNREVFALIPSVAPHLQRDQNTQVNAQTDLGPLVSLDEKFSLEKYLAKRLRVRNEDILSYDLFLTPFDKGFFWGPDKEFFSSDHIDDLECGYTTLRGFLNTFHDDNINVFAAFDNEEVGSLTRQGADSDLLQRTLEKICHSLKLDYDALLAQGMCLSCDNAHARHINHGELSDPVNAPVLNGGVVLKYNANQSYTSDGIGIALLKELMMEKKIPYQFYTNRSDIRGGGTLGNISNRHVSVLSVDIGLAQLAMHSPLETAGSKDVESMISLSKAFYEAHFQHRKGIYTLR